MCTRKCIDQDLSQAAPHVRVIICYQDIHCCFRLSGRNSDLKLLYPASKGINISVGCDLCRVCSVYSVGFFLRRQQTYSIRPCVMA